MRKSCFLLGLAVNLLTVSCQDQPTPKAARSTGQAFDLIDFLDQEAKALSQSNAKVKKTVLEEGQVKETKVVQNLDWPQELGTFADADLNKPALRGLFNIERTTNGKGQQVHHYKVKEDADAIVKEAIYTLNGQGKLIKLEVTMLQKNFLFTTHKKLVIDAQPGSMPQLQSYSLDESQALLFSDSERYGVQGEIVR